VRAPIPSPMVIELVASRAAARLTYTLYFDNGARLVCSTQPNPARPGAKVDCRARIVGKSGILMMGSMGTASGTVIGEGRPPVVIDLVDDGAHGDGAPKDGVFGGSFHCDTEGLYTLHLEVRQEHEGHTTVRSLRESFAVLTPGSASFLGNMTEQLSDTDESGHSQALKFLQSVTFGAEGRYEVVGQLFDDERKPIEFLAWSIVDPALDVPIMSELIVPGASLVHHGKNGPYLLAQIAIRRVSVGIQTIATTADYRTAPYDLSVFEPLRSPTIASLLPEEGGVDGGYEVTITGDNLWDAYEVIIDGQSAVPVTSDYQTIQFVMPAIQPERLRDIGSTVLVVDVSVVTKWGRAKRIGAFEYQR
ncbi:MAG TPA: IPT/TIG domain-containing protein, partial [Gemmatimonadales bacterium]|nr:IPT/TIG domain-containing protein [Gemmatimonadales bacterium]